MPTTQDAVLRQMRTARRKNRGAERDWIDTSYELWVRGFFAVVIIVVVPIILTGDELGAAEVMHFRDRAPGVASIIVALAVWFALRAGAAGAPLAPEAPDVVYLLLAPLSRAHVLRPLARQQLRTAVVGGAVIGLAIGQAAAARLPEGPGAWAWHGSIAGAALGALLWGVVAATSSRRLSTLAANALGLLLLAAAVADATFHTWFAPTTWVSSLALLPLHGLVPAAVAVLGIALAVVLPVVAILAIGGTSLEPLRQRSALVSQMRFAASLQDMRTVVLLHRQLSMEKSRSRPWIPLPTRRKVRRPAWRRGWHGYLRWPANRVVRVAVLLAATGAVAYASRSTHLLIIVAGATLFVAALDFIEPFAAELDHPTALLTYGVSIRAVLLRNLAAPVAALVGVSLIGAGALALATDHLTVVVFACALSASLAALAGSALNVALGPPPASQLEMLLLMPDIYGLILLVRQGLPPALAIAGLAPIAVASTAGAVPAIIVAVALASASTGALLYAALRGV